MSYQCDPRPSDPSSKDCDPKWDKRKKDEEKAPKDKQVPNSK